MPNFPMANVATDERFLRKALELARAGVGLAAPNPYVGAIIVDDAGIVLGFGTHTYDGVKHAEVLAIDKAGSKAKGATLYLNLEPCSHQGRTGPCADAVIAAGIRGSSPVWRTPIHKSVARVLSGLEMPGSALPAAFLSRRRENSMRLLPSSSVPGFHWSP